MAILLDLAVIIRRGFSPPDIDTPPIWNDFKRIGAEFLRGIAELLVELEKISLTTALLIVAGLVAVFLGLKALKSRLRREEEKKRSDVAKKEWETRRKQAVEKTKAESKKPKKTVIRDDEGTDHSTLNPLTPPSCRFFETEQEADEYIDILLDNEVMNDLRFFETEQEADEYIVKFDLENFYPKHCGGAGAPYLWIITDGFGRYVRYVTLSSTRPCSGRHPLMDYDEWDSIGR